MSMFHISLEFVGHNNVVKCMCSFER